MNLQEWIDHYIWQGVDHFYLIDNGSTDQPLLILQKYIDSGKVTYYHLTEPFQQVKHYQTVYADQNLQSNTKWLIMADLDEFWYVTNGKILREAIEDYSDYDVIYSKWKVFGSSGLKIHPTSIRESFIMRHPSSPETTKWIAQTAKIDVSMIHIHHVLNNFNYAIVDDVINVNHYPIQSSEFFEKVKMQRGDVNLPEFQTGRNWGYFNMYDAGCTEIDTNLSDQVKSQKVQ